MLANVPPTASGWSVASKVLPSPPVKPAVYALFKTDAPLTCLLCAIDRASARV